MNFLLEYLQRNKGRNGDGDLSLNVQMQFNGNMANMYTAWGGEVIEKIQK